jgi:hypothetical protein
LPVTGAAGGQPVPLTRLNNSAVSDKTARQSLRRRRR